MTEFLLIVVLVVLFTRWIILSGRLADLERKIQDLDLRPADARLIERVYALETAVLGLRPVPPSPPSVTGPLPEPAKPAPVPGPSPQPLTIEPRLADIAISEASFATTMTPSLSERLREKVSGEEWEAIVGGSWLNKLGVFVLVIGIALFLGYSFTEMGPPGRVAIGLAVSVAMLGGGITLEKRSRYTIFGRGLLGGGWAAIYFTTYAMQAVDAARVINNPVAGSLLLLLVATGMIVHSLKYRSQTVTGLAYFLAFVTLAPAITTAAALSVVALVPLAASLLYVANRFQWSQMAVLGLVATYGSCASRGDSGAALWTAQAVFTTYWLLFEAFDLLRAWKGSQYTLWEQAIFPLNTAGFVLLSYAKWSAAAPQHLFALAGGIAAAYLVSAAVRAFVRPPSSFPAENKSLERAFSGGYEGPVTLTAALTLAAIFLRFHGTKAQAGLLAEAEIFFLAGFFFGEAYPRQLAAALFAGGLGKLLLNDIPDGARSNVGGWSIMAWTPVTALSGLLFYVNRILRSSDTFYGYAGSAVAALILGYEMPQRFLGPAWFALAAVLFGLGWLRRLRDLRIQGYMVSALGLCGTAMYQVNVATGTAPPLRHPWISLACAALLSYAGVVCALRSATDRLEEWERMGLRRFGSWAATVVLVALAWRVLPGDYLGLGWMAAGLALLELGLRQVPEDFRVQSYVVAALGALRVLLFNLIPVTNAGPIVPRLTIAGAALLAYAIAARIYRVRGESVIASERTAVFDISSAVGALFVLGATWALLPAVVVGPAWAIVSLLLIEAGIALDAPSLRLQGHIAAASSFGRLFFANFTGLGSVGFVSHRLLTVVPVICSQYYQWSRQSASRPRLKDWELPVRRIYLYAAAALGIALMHFELGRVLTVTGWAALALALLMFGHRWNSTDLRWQSYALAALVFWRSWTTNFYAPESFAGMPGRVFTGAFVIICFYAAQLLIPRKTADHNGVEHHSRLFYSMLATVLLAVLLFYEVSGSMLTVAWGIEGVALLIAGFPLSDRVLRVSGLTLFMVCVLKLFLYDLRHLETMYRILSFIVLGLMLVSVSWIYTRFHDRVQRYL